MAEHQQLHPQISRAAAGKGPLGCWEGTASRRFFHCESGIPAITRRADQKRVDVCHRLAILWRGQMEAVYITDNLASGHLRKVSDVSGTPRVDTISLDVNSVSKVGRL